MGYASYLGGPRRKDVAGFSQRSEMSVDVVSKAPSSWYRTLRPPTTYLPSARSSQRTGDNYFLLIEDIANYRVINAFIFSRSLLVENIFTFPYYKTQFLYRYVYLLARVESFRYACYCLAGKRISSLTFYCGSDPVLRIFLGPILHNRRR